MDLTVHKLHSGVLPLHVLNYTTLMNHAHSFVFAVFILVWYETLNSKPSGFFFFFFFFSKPSGLLQGYCGYPSADEATQKNIGELTHKQLKTHACILRTVATDHALAPNHQGAVSIRKTVLPGMAIPMLKIRRPNGRLIFNMEIAIRR